VLSFLCPRHTEHIFAPKLCSCTGALQTLSQLVCLAKSGKTFFANVTQRVNLVEWGNSIAVMPRVLGSTLCSWLRRHSIRNTSPVTSLGHQGGEEFHAMSNTFLQGGKFFFRWVLRPTCIPVILALRSTYMRKFVLSTIAFL